MKIVWLSHSTGDLGAERAMIEAIGGLLGASVEVHVVFPEQSVIAGAWRKFPIGYSQMRVPSWVCAREAVSLRERASAMYRLLKALPALTSLLKKERPGLVITNTIVTPLAALAARRAGIPHVWYIHEFGDQDHGFAFLFGRRLSVRMIGLLSDRVIVNSPAVRAHFTPLIPTKKTRLVYNAVEAPEPPPAKPPNRMLSLVLVGGLSPAKRQEDGIRAVSILKTRGIMTHLTIVGPDTSDYLLYLRRLAEELDVANSICFAGATSDPFSYFAAADVALMCSRNEAFGRVTVEAMKMGTPVIGANSGGTASIVQDGFNGLLYESQNVEDLADKIQWAMENPQLVRKMGDNARRWANATFSVSRHTADLLSVFNEAAGQEASQEDPDHR